MDTKLLDRDIATLDENKTEWARLPIGRKITYLQQVINGTLAQAERQVAAALQAKGLAADAPISGEEWMGGPVVSVRTMRLTLESLRQVASDGAPKLKPGAVRQRADGQVVVEVFPHSQLDKMMWKDWRADVWMDPQITPQNLAESMAGFYRQTDPVGRLALVLGAGNVASIGPLDMVYKLFIEGQVCLYKLNPVNEYLGPFIEGAFSSLVRDGFIRIVYGGGDVGEYLCQHPAIEEIHITGSDRTHDVIVFGPGEEGAQAKQANQPRLDKRITSELGNVSPVLVVPGPWSDSDIRFHAENIATQMVNNGGFNCNAAKLIVLQEGWNKGAALMSQLREVLAIAPQRPAYYPGAEDRYDRFVSGHRDVWPIGEKSEGVLPWTLFPDLDANDPEEICFTTESFCGVTGQTTLEAADAAEFLHQAVDFANDTLWGCC